MIPMDKEAEFFSIYEISERGTSWMGRFYLALSIKRWAICGQPFFR